MHDVNWDDLRMLLAVFRAGSFSAGARELGLGSSTVSRRAAAIEEALGVRLLQRTPEGLLATTAGEHLRELAEQSEAGLVAFRRAIAGGDMRLGGVVRLAIPDLAAKLLMPTLAEFERRYPGIALDIAAGREHVDLLRGEADVAIRNTNSAPESAVGRRLGTLEVAMYVSRTSRGEAPPYISLGGELRLPDWYRARFPNSRLGMRVNSLSLVFEAVRAGLGAGALPVCIAGALPEFRRMDGLPGYELGVWALTHADLRRTARVRVLLDWLGAVVPGLLSSGNDEALGAKAQPKGERLAMGTATSP